MFKLNPSPTFSASVSLSVPGGTVAELPVVFKHKGRKALAEWVKRPAAAAAEGRELSDAEYLAEVIEDATVFNDEGVAVPFSVDVLAQVLDAYPAAGGELFAAYMAALTEAKAKN